MLELTDITSNDTAVDDEMTLTYEARQKCRLLSRTDSGREIGLFLPRGQILHDGLVLTGHDHYRVRIKAASEKVSIIRSLNSLAFARACYHLGNRHVPLQILAGELRYLSDHVLDQMLEGLGFQIMYDSLPFEPEHGAYHTQHGH